MKRAAGRGQPSGSVPSVGVLDAGVVIGWILHLPRSKARLDALYDSSRAGRVRLVLSVVNLAEAHKHTASSEKEAGTDILALLRAHRVEIHTPTEDTARRVSRLRTSLGDAFAAATALELRARLHTTDEELVKALRGTGLAITRY